MINSQRFSERGGAQGRTHIYSQSQQVSAAQPAQTAHAILRRPEGGLSNLKGPRRGQPSRPDKAERTGHA